MTIGKLGLTLALALALPASAQAAVNLVVNGDFTQPGAGTGWTQRASIPGWLSESGDRLEIGHAAVYGATCRSAACQLLELNANRFGSVSQTITGLTAGVTYAFGWSMAGRNGGGPQQLNVSLNGVQVGGMTSSGFGGWIDNAIRFTALAPTAKINFASRNVGGNATYGNLIADVSVGAVPEPASWVMMIAGFGLVGLTMRRRASRSVVA